VGRFYFQQHLPQQTATRCASLVSDVDVTVSSLHARRRISNSKRRHRRQS